MPEVDVVVVAYNSRATLRPCVEILPSDSVHVFVVDNASPDGALETISDLPVTILRLDANYGFAHGCNRGWQAGSSPYVLFLNPDARIDVDSLRRLVAAAEEDDRIALVGPRLVDEDGALEFSQRRFPSLRSTYAQALFLHRLWPHAPWTDELVRDPAAYETPRKVDWISGACILARRTCLEEIGGWDEGFFHYSEDKDLCRRVWTAGYEVRYEPAATVTHLGGTSMPRPALIPVLANARIRYAKKHSSPATAFLHRTGIGLGALTHALLTTQGGNARAGHRRALRLTLRRGAGERLTRPPTV